VNTNEEQTKEEVVVIGVKQPKKEIEKAKAICTEMTEQEIDKPIQVDESQMSLITIVAMSRVGKEWEDVADRFLVAVIGKTNNKRGITNNWRRIQR